MQTTPLLFTFFGTLIIFQSLVVSTATIINCPSNSLQEQLNPAWRKICFAVEQAMEDTLNPVQPLEYLGRLNERSANLNEKRQDVDHVFLRFGRRFGL